MKKRIVIVTLLAIFIATVLGAYLYLYLNRAVVVIHAPVPAITVPAKLPQQVKDIKPLNLALPEEALLMDRTVELPGNSHNLHKLFEASPPENTVSVGGHFILDENPKPNAGVWDTVKGAEVGVTIKTP